MRIWLPVVVLVAAYTVNMTYITVFYHRGVAHGALRISPRVLRFVAATGNWVTGIDLVGWACMHRMHHAYADGPDDPHSPRNAGIVGVALAQLRSYERVLAGLARGDERYARFVRDLDIPISALNRRRLWALPYAVHAGVAVALALGSGWWPVGVAYFVGVTSHPVQGWLVNSLGHAVGRRNFDTRDDSRNNLLVGLTVFGEGLQNNHHAYPRSARFSYHWWEPDPGWWLCRALALVGVVQVRPQGLIPRPGAPAARPAAEPAEAVAP